MKIIWSTLLKSNFFRKALITHLKAGYFHELNHSISLGNGFWAHILENDAYDSFSEIFIKQEYLDLLPNKKISRIVDIGAHYGFFSLWLQSKFPETEICSLLVEPSPRACRSLEHLVQLKSLDGRFRFINKAIGNPKNKHSNFYDRPHMAGSIFASTLRSEDSIEVCRCRHHVLPQSGGLMRPMLKNTLPAFRVIMKQVMLAIAMRMVISTSWRVPMM